MLPITYKVIKTLLKLCTSCSVSLAFTWFTGRTVNIHVLGAARDMISFTCAGASHVGTGSADVNRCLLHYIINRFSLGPGEMRWNAAVTARPFVCPVEPKKPANGAYFPPSVCDRRYCLEILLDRFKFWIIKLLPVWLAFSHVYHSYRITAPLFASSVISGWLDFSTDGKMADIIERSV